MSAAAQLTSVLTEIETAAKSAKRAPADIELIVVSKTRDADTIATVLEAGHRIFGENRVQESQDKWPRLKADFPDVELHLIGPLQSNKSADAVALFDVIHTVDREKIAKTLAAQMKDQKKHLKIFIQVNTGAEEQKAGVATKDAVAFVKQCRETYGLDVIGLMCIPPVDENPGPHFALLSKLATEAGLEKLSMGMSGDFEMAIAFGASHVRVGSAIFGPRQS